MSVMTNVSETSDDYVLLYDSDVTQSADNEFLVINSLNYASVIGTYKALHIFATVSENTYLKTLVMPIPKTVPVNDYIVATEFDGIVYTGGVFYLKGTYAYINDSELGVRYTIVSYSGRRLTHVTICGVK